MIRRLFAALCCCAALNASPAAFSTDATDAWYIPAESGWGALVYQQGDTLFVSMFVYSASGAPVWYTATSASFDRQDGSSLIYSGALYQTAGTWLGAPWQPSLFSPRQVGTLTFTLRTTVDATIAYTVDGVTVTKNVTRFSYKNENLSGSYLGATIGTYSGCASNGYSEEPSFVDIEHSASNAITIIAASTVNSSRCVYSGTYSQTGKTGTMTGTFSCNTGARGSFAAFELEASRSGLLGRATSDAGGGCAWTGRIGGLRRGN